MNCYYPEYFDQFRCVAGDCPDSCCKEWTVDIDPESAEIYRKLPGDLGEEIRSFLAEEDGSVVMTIQNGRCPMWRQDGLCKIQAQLGHEALCKTCREFPRLTHDYGDFVEYGLELSCPEATKLILADLQKDLVCKQTRECGAGEYDTGLMSILRDTRKLALEFLRTSLYTPGQTLAILLLYSHGVQSFIDGAEAPEFLPEKLLEIAVNNGKNADADCFVSFFKGLEILTLEWQNRLEQGAVGERTELSLPLMGYFIQRYWLQAVSDYDLVCRVKLGIAGCLLVSLLGGDLQQTAQQFSKEIENNIDNVEAILDGAYTASALTDLNLLALLLNE